MPRAIDPSLPGGGLPVNRSPLNRIRFNVIPDEMDMEKFLEEIFISLEDQIRDNLFPAIAGLTGIDLSVLLPLLDVLDLDFSTPVAFLESLMAAIAALPAALAQVVVGVVNQLLTPGSPELPELLSGLITLLISLPAMLIQLGQSLLESGAGLLGIQSPLNSLNLFNLVPPNLMSQLNFSNIGETFTNLIADPFFEAVEAFTGLGSWFHDATNSHAAVGGSAMSIADGTLKELLGNLIPVSVGQVLNLSGWAKWTGLTGTGNPIMLAITGYDTTGSAIDQTTVASRAISPPTTDWTQLAGTYTVPAGVTGIRTRLGIGPTATAGTVWWDDMSANKTQTMFQRLMAGTNPGETLTNDVTHLFNGIVSNTLEIVQKASQGDFEGLVSTIAGDVQEGFEDVGDKLATFLDHFSPLNGSNIASDIVDDFLPGVRSIIDNIVGGLLNIGGSGFGHSDALGAFQSNAHALVDHGAGLSGMFSRLSNLESKVSALPVAAGGTGSGTASGGAVGVTDTDDFERTSSSSLGALWLQNYSGGSGTWATPNGHDATFATSGINDRSFLCIRNNSAIPRSQTDYQRVTLELSSRATRYYDAFLGTYDFCGRNDVWLRISDDTTSLANITGIRISWFGDGGLAIYRFVSGAATLLDGRGSGFIVPPGPGAQLIGEAGVLTDGSLRTFRAKIGNSIRLQVTETGTASAVGAAARRWGHGGLAEGHLLPLPGQEKPGGAHFWNGMDQTV